MKCIKQQLEKEHKAIEQGVEREMVGGVWLNINYIHHTSFSGAPRGAFQQPVYNKCKVLWLRVLARPLQAVHNGFLSETLSCALS